MINTFRILSNINRHLNRVDALRFVRRRAKIFDSRSNESTPNWLVDVIKDDEILTKQHGSEDSEDFEEMDRISKLSKSRPYEHPRIKLSKKEKRTERMNFNHIPIQDQIVVMFPGNGTQHLKMGNKVMDHPNSLRLFEEANEILGFDLLQLCLNGPKTKLDQICYSQLAIFVSSLAAFEELKSEHEQPDLIKRMTECAGLSLGELCALVATDVINFPDALKLLKISAETSQECSQISPSGLCVIRTCAQSELRQALNEARQYSHSKGQPAVCDIAIYLYSHVKVIGGTIKSLEYFVQHAEHFKIQVVKRLPISCAFHTVLNVTDEISNFLTDVEIRTPKINVYSNFSGKPHSFISIPKIKMDIARQISFPAKWEQIAVELFRIHQDNDFPSYFEVGPGKQLGTILQQVSKKTQKTYLNYPP